jgi:oligoendopeptidase F
MKISTRNEIEDKFKWDLSSIVKNDDEWQNIYDEVNKNKEKVLEFKGKLNNENDILNCLRVEDEENKKLTNLYTYASMKRDEDTVVDKYQSMKDKAEMLAVECSTLGSFIVPELTTSLSKEKMIEYSKSDKFSDYSYQFIELARKKEIILSEKEERIISETGLLSDNFHNIFSMFDNADVKFKPIKDENGQKAEMSHSKYSYFLQSDNRKVRKQAFESMFNAYKDNINTIAATYSGNVKKDFFYAKLRKFKHSLDYELYSENVPSVVYENLIKSIHNNTDAMHDYISLRKKVLGVKELHFYDLYVPIISGYEMKKPYEEAFSVVKNALKPLGDEYGTLLDKAHNESWIDVYENKNKRSGAYSWGTYTSHPYVLLNYTETTHDVFTVAHELGHSIHSYYSNKTQPFAKSGYEIFVAEVASTVNEVLLLKNLINNTNDDMMKKYLLSYFIEMFRTTVFRQSLFAEFEKTAHEMLEDNQSLTAESLSGVYYKLNETYYGKSLKLDDLVKYEWARIPHFYTSFYVYKYSTGMLSAVYIADNIINGNKKVIEGYKQFLCAGGSMPPCDILKLAGVDLTNLNTFDYSMKVFKDTLNELKALIDK